MVVGGPVLARRRALAAVLLAIAVALAGCGDDGTPTEEAEEVSGTEESEAPTAEWAKETVETALNPDSGILTGVDGDTVLLVTVDEEGTVTGHLSEDGGPVESGPPAATGATFLRLGGLARTDDGWIAMGSGGLEGTPPLDEVVFDLYVLTSPDGLVWSVVETTGLDQPADVSEVVATDDGVVALGTLRGATEPTFSGFRPVAWHSADGVAWTQVELPAPEGDAGVQTAVATDDGVLATGNAEGDGLLWAGTFDGTWELVDPEGLPVGTTLAELAVIGDDVLASGRDGAAEDPVDAAATFARSSDGGHTWTPVPEPPAGDQGEGWAPPLAVGAGRVFTMLTSYIEPGQNLETCYADVALCQGGNENVLYASEDDGDSWSRIDLSALDLGEFGRVDQVVASDDRIILLSSGEDTVDLWSTPASSTLAVEDEPVLPEADVRFLEEGEEPEVGVRYAAPLYTHCGIDWLYLGEEPWERTDDGPDTSDEYYGQGDIYGFATLTEDGTVEYTDADGELIATYGPPSREPEPCM